MKRKSIQFKFLATVISAMLVVTIFIGGISIYEVDLFVQRQTENFIKVSCSNEATQINDVFGDMEKSVRIMESYVQDFVESESDIKDRDKLNKIIKSAERMFADVAKNTSGVIAYYLRFAPEISDGKTGLFYSKTNRNDEIIYIEPTDLFLYDKEDTEHVGWFWKPYEAGEPVWMEPYYNQNNNIMMISYVIPMYYMNQFIGVVGMDFDYQALSDKVHEIKIYEHGFAHLEMDGVVIHHKNNESGLYSSDMSEEYMRVSEELVNGMKLVLSASYDDISQIRYEIAFKILFVVLFFVAVFIVIVSLVIRKIVHPLKKLTNASLELSKGNYDVEISHSDTYEIKLLSTAFEKMIIHLHEHQKLQHFLAYRDSLTGLRNTTSYKSWVTDFNKEMQSKTVEFGVIVLDINYLKETNDEYGHGAGNKLIITASKIISDTFKRSPVFRIGGDEFLVILQNRDLEERGELFNKFDTECANMYIEIDTDKIPVSIAKGFTKYDPEKDLEFIDVFNRADDLMYKNKRKIKEANI